MNPGAIGAPAGAYPERKRRLWKVTGTKIWDCRGNSVKRSAFGIIAPLFLMLTMGAPLVSAQLPDLPRPPDDFIPENKISGDWTGDISIPVEILENAIIDGGIKAGAEVWITTPNGSVSVTGGISGGSVSASTPGVTLSVEGGISGGSVSLETEGVTLEVTGDVSGGTVVVNGNVLVSGDVKGNANLEVSAEGAEVTIDGSVEGGVIRATAEDVTIDLQDDFVDADISLYRAGMIRAGRVAQGTTMVVDVEASPLTGVNISVMNDVVNLSISVDRLSEKPLEIEVTPPGHVYSYLKIDVENAGEEDISAATVEIRVEKSWLEAEGIGVNSVAVYRYKDEEWQKLAVEVTGEDETYVYLSASTPGFSTFAIVGEPAGIPLMLVLTVVVVGAALSIIATKMIVLKKRG